MEKIIVTDRNNNIIYDKHGRKMYVWSYDTQNSKCYVLRILEWISQGLNVITGGHQDLTLSQRAGGWLAHDDIRGKILVPIINGIFFWDKNHCQDAWENKV